MSSFKVNFTAKKLAAAATSFSTAQRFENLGGLGKTIGQQMAADARADMDHCAKLLMGYVADTSFDDVVDASIERDRQEIWVILEALGFAREDIADVLKTLGVSESEIARAENDPKLAYELIQAGTADIKRAKHAR